MLSPAAKAIAEDMRARGYRDDPDEYWVGRSVEDQHERMWSQPSRRRAAWSSIAIPRVTAGVGGADARSPGEKAGMVFYSMYSYPRTVELSNAVAHAELKPAWIEVPACFRLERDLTLAHELDGMEGRTTSDEMSVRFVFAFDQQSAHWIPIFVRVRGNAVPRLLW
jgi:hypothetical protein